MEERCPVAAVVVLKLSSDVAELIKVLTVFKKLGISIGHIESRQSKEDATGSKDYYIEFPSQAKDKETTLLRELREVTADITVHNPNASSSVVNSRRLSHGQEQCSAEATTPCFPRNIRDLKKCCTTLYKFGHDLSSDHPGYGDTVYMQRRKEIAELAYSYDYGEPIPKVNYSDFEIKTWGKVFHAQMSLYETHACKEYRESYPELFEVCKYREDNIPQLEDISRYLRSKTGWQVWPVVGWISSRDFLNCLAFRVFPTTQYVRHKSTPFYTPEPDICHEVLGHAPLFCDPSFARFSQEIGLASLGVSDEWITKLAGVYWFTVEFGVVRESGQLKAYGAGLLGGHEELQYCTGRQPEHKVFNIEEMMVQKYPETGLQPLYYVVDSLDVMKNQMIEFAKTIPSPFSVSYDPYTQSVRVLDSWQSVESHAADVKKEMDLLCDALRRKCC